MQLGVWTGQCKLRIAHMIKAGAFPLGAVVALLALLAHATGMRVLRPMATLTVLGDLVFHATGGMAAYAIGTRVRAVQGKTGFFGVVELGGGPTDRGMALCTLIAA